MPLIKSILDYSGVGDGTTNNNTAFAAMAADVGYVVFPEGVYALSTMTIDVPIFFLPGGAVTTGSGQTITITNRIDSPKQHSFRGAGNYKLRIDGEIGEDSKIVHAAWFGVFPVGATASSALVTAALNKALSIYQGQDREGIFELDVGSYYIDGKITIPRGIHLRGAGTRRTIFDLKGQGYTALEAAGDAVRITGVQFEQHPDEQGARMGILIDMLEHLGCSVEDIRGWGTHTIIKAAGNDFTAKQVSAVWNYGAAPGAGSSLIWLAGGSRHVIEDIDADGTTYGPETVVLIGNGNAASMTEIRVSGVKTTEDAVPVRIKAAVGAISMVNISDVIGVPSSAADAGVSIENTGAAAVSAIVINGVTGNSGLTSLVKMRNSGSGSIRYVSVDNAAIYGSTGYGVRLERTAGTLADICIGGGVNAIARSAPLSISGTTSNVFAPAYMSGGGTPPAGNIDADNIGINAGGNVHSNSGELDLRGAAGAGVRIRTNGNATSLVVPSGGVYANTTASSANVTVTAGNVLGRSTSSAKYKTDVEDLDKANSDLITKLRPVWYRSKCAGDNPQWSYYGLIAEEVAEVDPRLVHWRTNETVFEDVDGNVEEIVVSLATPVAESVMYERLVPHLIAKATELDKRLLALEQPLA